MDYSLTIKLTFSLFSFNTKNMRWFNFRRLAMSLLLIPLFIIFLVVNKICLFLDNIFFPQFRSQKIYSPVFIIAAPRSATTYLFHLLALDKEKFTSFKLWEIIFAPSIIQKYFFCSIFFCDRMLGNPLKKITLYFENKLLGNFKHIHKTGLNLPEEDEAILLWNMSTIYLNFFFPDTDHFKEYSAFDESMPSKRRNDIMKYYVSCIRRHNYFFNRNGQKKFLSKNPAMMAKIKSLHNFFPDALVLNINRCPSKTIPSTIILNNSIYHLFTSKKASSDINMMTTNILIRWYKMANQHLAEFYPMQTLTIDFNKLTNYDQYTINTICDRLNVKTQLFLQGKGQKKIHAEHISRNKYQLLEEQQLNKILTDLPFLAGYCTEGG